MKTFITSILGDQLPAVFLSNIFFAILGVALMLMLHTTKRNIKSKRTPEPFSWKFFFADNWKRVVSGLILIFIALRFTQELFGLELTPFWSFLIGCVNDSIAQAVKSKTSYLKTKIKQS